MSFGFGFGFPRRVGAALRATVAFNFLSGLLDPRITFTRTTTGTYVNSSGVISSAAINEPRFDYNPVTLAAKGLLIEEQRTNICLYSSDLTNPTWVYSANSVITGNTIVAPDGTTTADTITVNGSNNGVFQSIACASSTTYTWSLYVKLGTMAASDYKIAIYDNTNAAFIAADIVPTQTPSSTAWTRVTYTFTTPATCVSIRVYCFRNALSANTSVNVWGMQLEQGAFATSYIPTTTAALTRAADVASVTGANFSSWYNAVEGTMFAESTVAQYCPAGKFGQCVWQVDDGTSNNRMHVRNDATLTTNSFRSINVDGINAALTLGFALNVPVKTALAYKVNDFNGASSGSIGTTDTTVNPPVVNVLRLGQENSGLWLNGHIRSFAYYNTRLSNATLQSLTYQPPTPTILAHTLIQIGLTAQA